jgi:hypothetical protein
MTSLKLFWPLTVTIVDSGVDSFPCLCTRIVRSQKLGCDAGRAIPSNQSVSKSLKPKMLLPRTRNWYQCYSRICCNQYLRFPRYFTGPKRFLPNRTRLQRSNGTLYANSQVQLSIERHICVWRGKNYRFGSSCAYCNVFGYRCGEACPKVRRQRKVQQGVCLSTWVLAECAQRRTRTKWSSPLLKNLVSKCCTIYNARYAIYRVIDLAWILLGACTDRDIPFLSESLLADTPWFDSAIGRMSPNILNV